MTKIFAHRGSKGTHPENTIPAFQEAIDALADGIELDVQLTIDGHLVVIHDEKLNRTTNGKGWVKDYTLEEIKGLDAGAWFGENYEHTRIPTLEEVLTLLKENTYSGILNIELKTDEVDYPMIEEKVLSRLKQADISFEVILSSFNKETVKRLKELDDFYEKAFISFGNAKDMKWMNEQQSINSYHPYIGWLKRNIDKVSSVEMVRPWTVNKEKDMTFCFDNKLAGIFTDFPRKALEVRKNG